MDKQRNIYIGFTMKTITLKWLWIALFAVILFAGIGYALRVFLPVHPFEKACSIVFGIFMITGGGYGVLHNIFGEQKAEEIGTWIYGIIMAGLAVAFFGTLIVGGIVGLIKIF